VSNEPAFQPREALLWPEISSLLDFSDEDWLTAIRRTPLKRAKVKGLLRNLMVVAGNSGVAEFLPRLRRYLNHEDEHVRSHAAWAIRKLDNAQSSVPPETEV
jgi:epoxyqueuosine reductase